MWLPFLVVILLCTLHGCAAYTHSPPLSPDKLGTAVDCDWDTGQPRNCVIDPTRATIDVDRLNALIDRIEQCRADDMKRRKL